MTEELIPRIDGVSTAECRARFDACTTVLTERMDPADYRSWTYYVERAHAAFAMGHAVAGVVEDLFMAARCLRENQHLHLGRHESRRFLTRRLHPIELALASGHPALMVELGEAYGLSLPLVMSRTDDALNREVAVLTSHFANEYCADHRALVGLGAVVFAGGLAALARAFEDEAALGLRAYQIAREGLTHRAPPEPLVARLQRYDALNLMLVDVINRDAESLSRRIPGTIATHEASLRAEAAGSASELARLPWIDLSTVALIAAATLGGMTLALPDDHEYRAFVDVFSAGPREDVLVEESEIPRDMLEQMGVQVRPPAGGDAAAPEPEQEQEQEQGTETSGETGET